MNMKKLLAAAMACALTLSLSVPAFATPNVTAPVDGVYSADVNVPGSTEAPTIKITVPTTGAVAVNPYKMTVTIGSDDFTEQVISAPMFIKNESDVAIAVNVTVTGTFAGEAVFATASTAAKSPTTKSVFMYLELVPSADGSAADFVGAYDAKATNMVLVGAKATTKTNVQTLAAGDAGATYAGFKLSGDAASAPAKPWTSADKVDVAIAFTFAPTVITVP